MKTQYRTIGLDSRKAYDEVDRLLANGWIAYRAGLFFAYLRKGR